MPEYRLTFARNVRQYQHHKFQAANDSAAKVYASRALTAYANPTPAITGNCIEWDNPHEFDDIDFNDPNIMLDRWIAPPPIDDARLKTASGRWDPLEEEILDPDHLYSSRARAFIDRIARLTLFGESDYVTGRPEGTDPEDVQTDLDWLIAQDETLESLIREARALTGAGTDPPSAKS